MEKVHQFRIGVGGQKREEIEIIVMFKGNVKSQSKILINVSIRIQRKLRFIKINIFSSFTPSVASLFIICHRKPSGPHSLLKKSKILPKVNDRKGIIDMFLFILDSKIEPFIVTSRIAIIVDEQDIVIMLYQALID